MAQTSVVRIRLTLDSNKTRTLELPAPVSNDLTDPDTGNDLTRPALDALKLIYEGDDGASVVGATFLVVSTSTSTIESYDS